VKSMGEKRFKYVLGDGFSDGFIHLSATEVCELLNEQDRKIRQLEKSIERREEQISIIKKYCLKFLTDEQFETIRMALEDE